MGERGSIVDFGLLGPFEVRVNDEVLDVGSPKHRILLAALLLQVGHSVPVEALAEAIWGEAQPSRPRRAVQLYVTRLRQLLGDSVSGRLIATSSDGYQINVEPERIDLGRFHMFLDQAKNVAAGGDLEAEAAAFASALAQWRGAPLEGVPSELLQRHEVPRLQEQRLQALERRFDVELRRGRHAELVGDLSTLTTRYPLREPLWARLVAALAASGRRADALNAYHAARDRLAEELGIEPGEELRSLHVTVLAGGSRPYARSTSALPVPRQLPRNVRGFVGRAADLARLDTLLAGHVESESRSLVVGVLTGAAGAGKTALAAHWARRVADRFPDGQLWTDLRGYGSARVATAAHALTRFLRALGVPRSEIPSDPDEQTGLYRSLTNGRRMLVVLDNAHSEEQVRPLLPGAPGCLVLVTSRSQLRGLVATEGASPIMVDLLPARTPTASRLVGRL